MKPTIDTTRHRTGPPIVILGVPFDNVTTEQTISLVEEMVASRQPHYLATANVDFTVLAMKDAYLRKILLEAHLVVCDGMPLVWASKWLGNPLPERVAGSDLVPLLLQLAEQKGWRVFFLGGEKSVAKRALLQVRNKHPKLQIVGSVSPPFQPLTQMDHVEICRQIHEARPDLLFVSFGCPKQEKWIAMNYQRAGVPVSVGVGATIDFLAGSMKRAPVWMQRSGLEWIYRMLQEPKRLFRRYAVDLWVFGRAILVQVWTTKSWRKKVKTPKADAEATATPATSTAELSGPVSNAECHMLPERLDAAEVRAEESRWRALAASPDGLILDASALQFVDSTGVGLLLRLLKRCREAGGELVLLAPSLSLRRTLDLLKLGQVFPKAATREEAVRRITAVSARAIREREPQPLKVDWPERVTAGDVEKLWDQTAKSMDEAKAAGRPLLVDLARVGFMDSGALALMVRLKKRALHHLATISYTQPQPYVHETLRVLNLEEYLLHS